MANGTITGSYRGYEVQSRWSSTGNIEGNYSTVYTEHYLVMQKGYDLSIASRNNTCILDGVTASFTSNKISSSGNETVFLGATTHTIGHNSDGTKSATMTTTFNINATIGGTKITNIVATGTVTLDTIPRASQPSCITFPQTTEDIGDIGGKIYIHMNKKGNFTHTIRYVFGNLNEQIATNVVDNYQWEIPMKLCNQLPSSISGWGTIYVDTYSGSTKIGTAGVNFKCSVPNNVVPTISNVELTDSNATYASRFGVFIQGKTKLQIKITASGTYGSTITGYIAEVNETTYNQAYSVITTSELLNSGTQQCRIIATDTRGRQAISNVSYVAYMYSPPRIFEFNATRGESNASTVNIRIRASITSLNSTNTHIFRIKYKKTTQTSYSTYELDSSKYDIDTTILLTNFDENSSYDIVAEAVDYWGVVSSATSLPTAFTLINYRNTGKGIAFGKVSEKDVFELGMPMEASNNVYSYLPILYAGLFPIDDIRFIGDGYNKGIYWQESGFGDKFEILPSFGGTDDSNTLQIRASVGEAGTDPTPEPIATITGKSGNVWFKGWGNFTGGLTSYEYGYVNQPVGNGRLIIKKATPSDAPNAGIVLEYGNSTNWTGQLFFADNSYDGVWYSGWSNGVRDSWHRLADEAVTLYDNAEGSSGTITLSQNASVFHRFKILYHTTGMNCISSIDVEYPDGVMATLETADIDTYQSDNYGYVHMLRLISISGNTISTYYKGGMRWFAYEKNPSIGYMDKQESIKIYKVLGYR